MTLEPTPTGSRRIQQCVPEILYHDGDKLAGSRPTPGEYRAIWQQQLEEKHLGPY